jgi:pimeloyl-ACP methyl ester carboxylesterase
VNVKTTYSKDGTAIAYDAIGSGPPVILVGGALSWRKFPFTLELVDLLKNDFTVYNYDRRGRGDSGDTKPYAAAREIEDLAAMLHAAGGRAHVFGTSSGAALALAGAAAGLPIERLALYEPPYMVGEGGHRPPKDHREQARALVDAGKRSAAVTYFMVDVVGMPRPLAWIFRLMPFWQKLKATAHTLPYDLEIMGDFTFPEAKARSIPVPTAAISGEKSPPVLQRATLAVADANSRVRHITLPKQSHNVSMKVLAPVLIQFFGESGPRESARAMLAANGASV